MVFTSPQKWDLTVLDHRINLELLPDPDSVPGQYLLQEPIIDEFGELKDHVVMLLHTFLDASTQACNKQADQLASINWASLCPYFCFQSEEVIKATYQVTSHYAGMVATNDYLKKHFKTHSHIFNIPCRNEPITTDTVMSDTPATNDGNTKAQFFCGQDTLVCDVYGVKNLKRFANTLSHNICKCSAMATLSTDSEKYEVSKKVRDILHTLFISQYESQPCHQHQN